MIQLIALTVLAAVLTAGAYAIRSHIEGIGEKRITDRWGALITKCEKSKRDAPTCEKEWSDAQANVATLTRNNTIIAGERDACSSGVKEQGDKQKAVDLAVAAAITASAKAAQSAQAEAAAQRAKSKEPAKTGVTCEQTLKAVDTSLDELAARRLRFNPPAAAGGTDPGKAPDPGAGAGALRIAP